MGKNKIIINADDFGMSKNVNAAILDSFKKNYISSATIMANMDGFEEAVNMVHRNNLNSRIGIHLNISEGQPITTEIKKYERFCDSNGYFINKKYSYKKILNSPSKDELRVLKNELNAQIKKCKDNGLLITHADSHHHKHTELYMLRLLKNILHENGIGNLRLARTSDNKKNSLKFFYRKLCNMYIRKVLKASSIQEFVAFQDINSVCKESKVIEIMCHPIYEGGDIMEQGKKLDNHIRHLKSIISFELISYSQI